MFRQCPFRYYKTKIKGWKPAKIPEQLKKGIEIHDHLEHATTNVKTIADVKAKIMQRPVAKEQVKDIINFFNWQSKRKLPLYVEQDFFNKEHNLSGRVDRIDINEQGKLVMVDYKSGKGKRLNTLDQEGMPMPDWSYYRFELAIYTFLFESSHNQTIDKWGIYFTGINRYVEEPVIRQEIVEALKKVHAVRAEIQKAIDTNEWPKNYTYLCRYCEIFQNNECDCGEGKHHEEFDENGEMVF